MDYGHRPLRPEDAPTIRGFPRDAEELFFMFPAARWPLTAEALLEAAVQRSDPTVVESGGRVVAYANLVKVEPRQFAVIGNVVVAPSERGRGAGRYLVEAMAAKGFAHGVREVRVSCHSTNAAGLLLYAALGFEPYAIEKVEDWTGGRAALIHFRRRPPEVRLSDLLGDDAEDPANDTSHLIPFPGRPG